MGDIIRFEQIGASEREGERMTKLEFEARVEFMESYASEMGKMRSADLRLEELEMDYGPGVPKLTGMPSGGKSSDGSDRIIRRLEDKKAFKAEYIRHRNAALKEMNSIEAVIAEISPKLQKVLRYRYLNEMDIGEIAEELNYSYRQVQRHHQQGIERIRPPKHKINKIKERLLQEHPEWAMIEMKSA
jgi:hypothetical protein